MISMKKFFLLVLMSGIFFVSCPNSITHAEIAEGMAAIINGDVEKAKFNARQDAMRNFVESKIGVQVTSETEIAMNMLVSDKILTKSDGYVQVKKVVKEWQSEGIFYIQLDLTADVKKIEVAAEDLKTSLQNIDENSDRYGVQVVVSGRDENNNPKPITVLRNYVMQSLESVGFVTSSNDEVLHYLDNATDLNDPKVNAEVRRLAKGQARESENSILRGTLSTKAVKKVGGSYQAVVLASFELIGLDDSRTNTFADYVSAVAKDESSAVLKAEREATQKAVEVLAKKALETVQDENRGGVRHIKLTAIFNNIIDRKLQDDKIMQGLSAANCRVIRRSYANDGSLRIFFETTTYRNFAEIEAALKKFIPELESDGGNDESYGSTRLYFRWR